MEIKALNFGKDSNKKGAVFLGKVLEYSL